MINEATLFWSYLLVLIYKNKQWRMEGAMISDARGWVA